MATPGRSRTLPLLAWLVWIDCAVVLAVKAILTPAGHSVFPIYASAALGWWHDLPIYRIYTDLDVFRYPPAFAIALTPLAALGLTVGGILWAWLSLAVYGWGCWRLLRNLLPEHWSPTRVQACFVLCLVGGTVCLWNGQANTLVVGMVLLGIVAAWRARTWHAALWLGGAVLVKGTPLPIVALVCLVRPRQLLVPCVLVVLVGLLVPFATRPAAVVSRQYAEWVDQAGLNAQIRWPGARDAWTLYQAGRWACTGRALNACEANDVAGYRWAQVLGGVAAALVVLALRRRGVGDRDLLLVSLALGACWSLLLGPSVERATRVVLLPSLLLSLLLHRPPGRVAAWLLRGAVVGFLLLAWNPVENLLRPVVPWSDAAMPLGVLLYTGWVGLWAAGLQRQSESRLAPASGGRQPPVPATTLVPAPAVPAPTGG